MEQKKKVLVLYNKLFHYRIPIFNLLAEKYDLTVAYSFGTEGEIPSDVNFKTLYLPYRKIGKFVLQKANVYKLCCNYDVVVTYGEIAWLKNTYITIKRNRPFGVVPWTIGVSASYDHSFDRKTIWNTIAYFIRHRADALVFYSNYPINKHLKQGFDGEMLFVANNTVQVNPIEQICHEFMKDSLLFIGTMYMQKGVRLLLEEYNKAYNINREILPLNLVGGGSELHLVEQWVKENGLQDKIRICGPIYDIEEKAKYFARAYVTLSPVQAGLSVLESMGYGVPFVTTKTAITGGEIFNIVNGENGILLDSYTDLHKVILDVSTSPAKYIELGINSKKHYDLYRKPSDMAKGLSDAIEYASCKINKNTIYE